MHLIDAVVVWINSWLLEEHKSQTSNIVNLVEKEPITKQKKNHHRRKKPSKKKTIIAA